MKHSQRSHVKEPRPQEKEAYEAVNWLVKTRDRSPFALVVLVLSLWLAGLFFCSYSAHYAPLIR